MDDVSKRVKTFQIQMLPSCAGGVIWILRSSDLVEPRSHYLTQRGYREGNLGTASEVEPCSFLRKLLSGARGAERPAYRLKSSLPHRGAHRGGGPSLLLDFTNANPQNGS